MKKRVTYRPSKAQGAFGVVWGGIFVLIGLFVVVPAFGAFGLLWTCAAIAITGMNAYRAFGKGYAGPEIHIEEDEDGPTATYSAPEPHEHIPSTAPDAKARLEQIKTLKDAGLITDREYEEKRRAILKEL